MCMSGLRWTSVKFVIRINCKCIEVTTLCCVHGLFCHRLNFELYLGCNYCITLLKTCAVFSCYLLLRIQFSTHLSKRTGLPRWQRHQITCRWRRLRRILSVTYIPANQSSVANMILPPISLQDKSFNSVNFGGDMLLHRLDVVKLELVYVGFEKSLVIGQSSIVIFIFLKVVDFWRNFEHL